MLRRPRMHLLAVFRCFLLHLLVVLVVCLLVLLYCPLLQVVVFYLLFLVVFCLFLLMLVLCLLFWVVLSAVLSCFLFLIIGDGFLSAIFGRSPLFSMPFAGSQALLLTSTLSCTYWSFLLFLPLFNSFLPSLATPFAHNPAL